MNDMQSIFNLQIADLQIDDLQEKLDSIKEKLSSDGDLEMIKNRLDKIKSLIEQKELQKRTTERTISDLQDKIKELQALLYGGVITNEKELQALEEQKVFLSGEVSSQEDELLEVMIEIDQDVSSKDKHVLATEKLTAIKSDESVRFAQQQDEFSADLKQIKSERDALIALIPADILALYEKLKKNKGGHAVSKLEGRICGVCRVELPVKEFQDARAGLRLVQCNSCRRIIYVS